MSILHKIVKVANALDKRGFHTLATQLDEILDDIVDPDFEGEGSTNWAYFDYLDEQDKDLSNKFRLVQDGPVPGLKAGHERHKLIYVGDIMRKDTTSLSPREYKIHVCYWPSLPYTAEKILANCVTGESYHMTHEDLLNNTIHWEP